MASIKSTHNARTKPEKKQYKIYDLSNENDRKEFSHSVVYDTFALIKIPDEYRSSLSDLRDIFRQVFKSNKSLECDHNSHYVGYTSTEHVKQSLWCYLDYNTQTIFPMLKDKYNVLYQNNNEKKAFKSFNDYNKIATDALDAILRHQSKDEKAFIQCWNNLFPSDTIHDNIDRNSSADNKQNDDDNVDIKHEEFNQKYIESAVYHGYRKSHNLSLNNLAIIQYFGDKNKKTKTGLIEKMKNIKKDNRNKEETMARFPCEEHMDYDLITVIMANEPGLQVRDMSSFDWIAIDDIITASHMDRKNVLAVISGLTLGTLMHDRVSCYHSVKQAYKGNDRMSFPLFCYADPNGIMDVSLMKPNPNFRITARDQRKVVCSEYLAKNMHPSVNF